MSFASVRVAAPRPVLPASLVLGAVSAWTLLAGLGGCGDQSGDFSSALAWRDLYQGPPPSSATAVAEAAAACDGRVHVLGDADDRLILRTYDAVDGTLLWEDLQPFGDAVYAQPVACDEQRVLAAGFTYGPGGGAFLRAYDAGSGALLWEFVVDEGAWTSAVDLAADKGEVLFLTKSAEEADASATFDVWAIDGATGALRWRTHEAGADAASASSTLAVTETQVCTVRNGQAAPLLRCLDRRSGSLAWHALDLGVPGVVVEPRVPARGDFAVFGRGEGFHGIVAAYDPRDGALLWKRDDFDAITNVHTAGDTVIVTGIDFALSPDPEDPIEIRHSRVTGMDRHGRTDWEDIHWNEGVRASVVSDGRLFVAGEEGNARVYDTESGRLLAEQELEAEPPTRWTWDVAAEGEHYALVGATHRGDPGSHLDFAVRAYLLAR